MATTGLAAFVDGAAAGGIDHSTLLDRYRAVMLGVATGNALGVAAEGESRSAIRRHWPDGLRDIDPAERGRPWDDDLAETVVLAKALLRSEELNPDLFGLELVQWKRESGRGIGALTRDVVAELESGKEVMEAARNAWERSGWSSAGNGAVARCAPVALRCRSSGAYLIRTARTSALATHYDARCEWSTVVVAALLAVALSGGITDFSELAAALQPARTGEWESAALEQVVEAIREADGVELEALELDDPMDMGYTLKAMKVALWCAQQEDDLESIVISVVGSGGATDTNGAIAGAVMGARMGTAALPRRWLDNVARHDEVVQLADQLYDGSDRRNR
ncbi:MAG: ADP-ribosylglycohydrolase family protein [Actinomycetota bacterium]